MEQASTIHIGARKGREGGINEDSVATATLANHHRDTERPVGVFVLGDGVGGAAGGDVASFILTAVVRDRLVEALAGPATDRPDRYGIDGLDGIEGVPTVEDRPDDTEAWLREVVQDAVDEAHQAIQEYAREASGRPATTAVVAVYLDGTLHYAWAGDSRLYLVNEAHGEIQQLTEDHAVTNRLLEEGEIDDEEYARVHPDATAITNAVGGSPYGEPSVDLEFDTAEVFAEDRILLTSDGLVDAFPNVGPLREDYERADDKDEVRETIRETLVTDDEIRDVVLDAESLQAACDALVEFANDRGGKDNLSVTLARDPGAPESPTILPKRGVEVGEALADRETVIEAEETDAEGTDANAGEAEPDVDGDGDDHDEETDGGATAGEDRSGTDETAEGPLEVVSLSDRDAAVEGEPTAAVAIAGHGRLYEVADGFTVGRGAEDAADNPNLGLVLDDDTVDPHHARFERDGVAGYWRVRNRSDAGTYVRPPEEGDDEDDGTWDRLDGDDRETHRLQDGAALAMQDPDDDPVTLYFFTSVESAQQRVQESEADGDGFVDRFL